MEKRQVLMVFVVLTLGGCASLSSQIDPEAREDAVLATKVKTNFIDTPELAAAAIHVKSDQGVVMLTGFVESQPRRQQAETLAKTTEGVRRVINRIEMKW